MMQEGSRCFSAYDLCHLKTSTLGHHARRTLKEEKISTTGRSGALMDLVVLRNTAYSGYAI
jgi:hypothetical protein